VCFVLNERRSGRPKQSNERKCLTNGGIISI
jgi:hypothetical protein